MNYSKEWLMWELNRARTLRAAGEDEQPVVALLIALLGVVVLAVAA